MKAAVFAQIGKLEIQDRREPQIVGTHDVKVAPQACGICGTDLHILSDPPGHPGTIGAILGHEFVANVVQVGSEVRNVAPGQRVAIRPIVSCGACRPCLDGAPNHCSDMQVHGVFKDGGLAEFLVVPDTACLPISAELPLEVAALIEPTACVMSAIRKIALIPGESVVIIGAGAIGLLFTTILKSAGAGKVLVVEPSAKRADIARLLGAAACLDPGKEDVAAVIEGMLPHGADVVVDAVGSQLPLAIQVAGRRGRIALFGMNTNAHGDIPQHVITERELVIFGSFVGQTSFPDAIRLIESNPEAFAPIVSHIYQLAELPDRISQMRSGEVVKAIVRISES